MFYHNERTSSWDNMKILHRLKEEIYEATQCIECLASPVSYGNIVDRRRELRCGLRKRVTGEFVNGAPVSLCGYLKASELI